MDETTNMKLKKPVENEYISIEIINENMDIIDTGMKEISDSVDAPVFDDSGNVEGITNKTTLLASFVSKMPLVQFLRNVKAGFKLVSFVGDIVNNCVTDNANLPLSAAQGKALMDLYTVLNTKITFDRVAIMQPFFDDADKSFGFRSYYNISMTAGYAIHFYYSDEKRITLRFLDTDGTWKDSWTGKLQ